MSTKNIRLKDSSGNVLYPQTLASLTLIASGGSATLADAVTNVKVNGSSVTVSSNTVDISVPSAYNSSTNSGGYMTKTDVDTVVASAQLSSTVDLSGYVQYEEIN